MLNHITTRKRVKSTIIEHLDENTPKSRKLNGTLKNNHSNQSPMNSSLKSDKSCSSLLIEKSKNYSAVIRERNRKNGKDNYGVLNRITQDQLNCP